MEERMNWRFPASNFGDVKGISTGDDETFKKAPYKSFAREILQNSIDVPLKKDKPVYVEISEFEIKTENIPGIIGFKENIKSIISYWRHKKDYLKIYENMLNQLNKDSIACLKISDYNTTGLTGIYSDDQKDNKWLALTQGAGVSEKSDSVSGGSKGIGKNAAFELSTFKMVFYSTYTSDGREGSMGVSKLISGYVKDDKNERRDHTQGTGYFALDEYNTPIKMFYKIDPDEEKREEPGTDIYIIGFEKDEGWEKEAINSILDSFMAAIVMNELKVKINDTLIDSETVKALIDSDIILDNNKANVISQYKLLTGGNDIHVFDIDTDYGTPKLYVWVVPREDEELATHNCVMIRHPLMKITNVKLNPNFKVSAMCIIGDDKLGEYLLKIENPQHTDWETGRIKDKTLKASMVSTIRSIKNQITSYVTECLKIDDDEPIDPYGAGEYLPEDVGGFDKGEIKKKQSEIVTENITVSKAKEAKYNTTKTIYDAGEKQYGLVPDIMDIVQDEHGDVYHPDGTNDYQFGNSHPGVEESKEKEGDSVMFKRSVISGIKYKPIVIDKKTGKYKIKFISPGDFDNCYLCISLIDDSNNKENVEIISLNKNGESILCEDKLEFGPFSINTNEKVELLIQVNEHEYFGSEVKIVCK